MSSEWTPRRRGKIYCSPRCGFGCTHAEYLNAHRVGKALAKRLGCGWTHDVWENCHWHHNAISPCGRIKVHGDGESWTAFLGEPDSAGGRWAEHGKTPEEAVREVVKVAVAELYKIGAVIFDMSKMTSLPSQKSALAQASALFITDSAKSAKATVRAPQIPPPPPSSKERA